MTYSELYSIIRRSVSGNKSNSDDGFVNSELINRLVLSSRAFVLMKYTKSGRSYEQTLIQKLSNLKLTPVSAVDIITADSTFVVGKKNTMNILNTTKYINDLYYVTLPTEFLQWGNRRAIHSITDIDGTMHCQISQEGSVRENGDVLFKNAIPIAWVNQKKLFVRVARNSLLLNAYHPTTAAYVIDQATWPSGATLSTKSDDDLSEINLYAKFINVSGVFYDPIAAANYTTLSTKNDDLSNTEINIPYEFVDILVQQVTTTYLEKMKNTLQETTLDGKTENQNSPPPQ
jgi:hypothetical protein